MLDCMVDLETTGVLPDRTAILQISAVQFSLERREVLHNFFDRCLLLPPHRHWQESTRQWWASQRLETFQNISARGEPWRDVISAFWDWAMPANSLRLWAKPSHFEFPFLSSYFNDADLTNPFHYRQVNDLNSFIRGLWYPEPPPDLEREIEFTGPAHNALFDTLHQIKVLFAHCDRRAAGEVGGAIDADFEEVVSV
jgi:hypothetical protein